MLCFYWLTITPSIPENTAMSIHTAKFLKETQFNFDPSIVDPIQFEESGALVAFENIMTTFNSFLRLLNSGLSCL